MYNSTVQVHERSKKMVSIGISEFRASLNAVIQRVANGEIVSLTSRGVEVAKLVPPTYAQAVAREELKRLRKTAVIGDILTSLDEPWEVDS
jgi:prevent-host-death family protein